MRISENGSREVGIFDSSSAVKLVAVPVCLASTIGDAAATVIVSVSGADLHRHREVDRLAEVEHDRCRARAVAKPCSAEVTL